MNKTFITGVDRNFQDLLPWWINNIRKHDTETHITVADFGMDKKWAEWTKKNVNTFLVYPSLSKPGKEICSWFNKPNTLIKAPYEYKCWIDIDCEVLTNISEIFDFVDGTNIAFTNDPCRTREPDDPNTKWYATGVNVVKDVPSLLKVWDRWCLPQNYGIKGGRTCRGDQEVLHKLLTHCDWSKSIVEMPMEYQWLRIQLARGEDNPNKKIIHWTGPSGKAHIRSKM